MRTRVVTLMWGTAWDRYGQKFLETFEQYWPSDVGLYIVTDRELPHSRATLINLNDSLQYHIFMKKWGDDRKAQGLDRCSGEKLDGDGRSWRHNAVKWMPQGIAPRMCMGGLNDGDILFWLDADVETHAKVRNGWARELLDGHDVAALQRKGTHTEIGGYLIKIGPDTRKMLELFSRLYISGDVFALKEWHSAFVWDHALSEFPDLKVRNLSKSERGHVWPASPLAEFTIHKKGKRKPQ